MELLSIWEAKKALMGCVENREKVPLKGGGMTQLAKVVELSVTSKRSRNIETLSVPLFHASDVFLTDGSRVSAATVASTAIAAAQWAVTQVTFLNDLLLQRRKNCIQHTFNFK